MTSFGCVSMGRSIVMLDEFTTTVWSLTSAIKTASTTAVKSCSGTNAVFYVSFFFSSRRRHTRCSRDWSSDVCSSDLARDHFLGHQNRRLLSGNDCRGDHHVAFRYNLSQEFALAFVKSFVLRPRIPTRI